MRKTTILPWTKEWAALFHEEAERLKKIFRNELVDIFHIGSTSVQAIGFAKPIIDILIVAADIEKVDDCTSEMEVLGYKAKGENGDSRKKVFFKRTG